MGTEKIQVVATAQDRASPTIKKLRGNIAALGTRTGGPMGGMMAGLGGIGVAAAGMGVAAGLAGVAIGKMGEMLNKGVSDAIAEELSLKRLDAALQANITNWNGNRDAIDAAIEARMNLGFEDDVLRESMIKLVVATKDQNRALGLQDLAMDVARGRNIDLAAATDIVIKANMGNIGALRRMGIEIDKDATATEALAEIQSRYAGQTEAFMETTVGKLTVANTKLGEMNEDIGGMMLPLIADTATSLSGAADQAQRLFDLLGGIFNGPKPKGPVFGPPTPAGFGDMLGPMTPAIEAAGDGAARVFAREFNSELQTHRNQMATQGAALAREVAQGMALELVGSQPSLRSAWKELVDNPFNAAKEIAWINGKLTGQRMANGLASSDPIIKAQYTQMQADLQAQLGIFADLGYDVGEGTGKGVKGGLSDQKEGIVNTAEAIRSAVVRALTGGGKVKIGVAIGIGNKVSHLPGFAAGGDVSPGQTFRVGERGPETLTMGRRGGHVTPNHQQGGGPIHVVTFNELRRLLDEGQGRMLALAPSSNYSR